MLIIWLSQICQSVCSNNTCLPFFESFYSCVNFPLAYTIVVIPNCHFSNFTSFHTFWPWKIGSQKFFFFGTLYQQSSHVTCDTVLSILKRKLKPTKSKGGKVHIVYTHSLFQWYQYHFWLKLPLLFVSWTYVLTRQTWMTTFFIQVPKQ